MRETGGAWAALRRFAICFAVVGSAGVVLDRLHWRGLWILLGVAAYLFIAGRAVGRIRAAGRGPLLIFMALYWAVVGLWIWCVTYALFMSVIAATIVAPVLAYLYLDFLAYRYKERARWSQTARRVTTPKRRRSVSTLVREGPN